MSLQVPTGDWDTDCHIRVLVKCTNNLVIQKFRSLANWIFHGVYDSVGEVVRQAAALGFLGSMVLKEVKRREVIWTSEERRRSTSRTMAAESAQLLGAARSAALAQL